MIGLLRLSRNLRNDEHVPLQQELDRFQSFLQRQGLKLTNERAALVREIFARHYHFDADELLFALKDKNIKISRATIYRTLDLLVKCNMVRRVHLGEDHYHYESVGQNTHHDHLICTTCGDVIEFHDSVLEKRQREICSKNNFIPTFHNLQILGVCGDCKERGEEPDSPDRVKMIQVAQNGLRK